MSRKNEISLSYLFFNFLKIGSISWGGFMALISVVRKQMVEKDKTVKDEVILDGISLASVLPGPVAFNVIAYIGYALRGIPGAIVSMIAIVLPSFFLILGLAIVYTSYGQIPAMRNFFLGVLPAVSAVIISVGLNMYQKQVKDWKQTVICILSGSALIFIHSFFVTLGVIVASALAGYLIYHDKKQVQKQEQKSSGVFSFENYRQPVLLLIALLVLLLAFPLMLSGSAFEEYRLLKTIFLTFSGMSLTLFGGGYVIIPAMQQIIVDNFHWLTVGEFADAIAMGQITPGPIFISATFIGFRIAGFLGGLVATIAVFFPPGMVMLIFSHFLKNIKQSGRVDAVFKGLRAAIIGMIFSAAITINKDIELSWMLAGIFFTTLVLLIRFKVDVVYLIPLAGLLGIVLNLF